MIMKRKQEIAGHTLKEAKWFLTNKIESKSWFGLFKSRHMHTGIKLFVRSDSEKETENLMEMLEIAVPTTK